MSTIRMGVPEMEELWSHLTASVSAGTASKDESRLYKRLGKAMALLSINPRHPGLQTHDIDALTRRFGMKVWQSYLENNTPGAGRIFWVYGPERIYRSVSAPKPAELSTDSAGIEQCRGGVEY